MGNRRVGIIHYGNRLEPFLVQGLMPEAQGSIGELSEAIVEEFVDRAGINEAIGDDLALELRKVDAELKPDVAMIEHVLEHARKTVTWHCLVLIGEIAVVRVGASGHACGDALVELRGVKSPLLARVAAEE